ncbi:site-2 protease family protein [candidate division WOR-3 bacterium]|nr:site-2 protease family protein [candidate division WOR-3 bacterium]
MKFFAVVLQLLIFFFSVIVHEVSHGYMALRKGDTTARDAGRLTLNPLPHIDIFGTIILPLILYFSIGWVFGMAKPVPINPYYLRDPKRDLMWIGAAGPLSNIGIAVVLGTLLRIIGTGLPSPILQFIAFGVMINLLLAFFNLIPIPPLDGSRIVQRFLSYEAQEKYLSIERFGIFIVLGFAFMGGFRYILFPLVSYSFYFLTGKPMGIYL